MNDLNSIASFLISIFSNIAALYTGSLILASVLGLWILRKVINVFRRIIY